MSNRIRFAHLKIQGINVAVFAADAPSRNREDRARLLASLTMRARVSGLAVSKSALAYSSCGRREYYGTPDLVRYLARSGVWRWTHTMDT